MSEYINKEMLQILLDLQMKTGRNILDDLVRLYVESTPDILSTMQLLLKEKKYEDLCREAHSLKSSSANLGACMMNEIAMQLEHKLFKNEYSSDQELVEYINKLEEYFPPTKEALESLS